MSSKIYRDIQELLSSVPKTGVAARTRWLADFNAMAQQIEAEIEHDPRLTDQVSLPPWEAHVKDDEMWLYSPPLISKKMDVNRKSEVFVAVRLGVNADNPIKVEHVNAVAIPVGSDFKIKGQSQYACVIVNTNADLIKSSPLVAVWFLWDTIARLGVENSLKQGLIAPSWITKVFEHANTDPCGLRYPRAYYKLGTERNTYLTTLYRLAEAREITEGMIHGVGSMEFNTRLFNNKGTDRTYVNSWIVNGVCKACKNAKPLSYGSGNYPYGSILNHVNSIRHAKNAIEFLLKKQQQKAMARVKCLQAKRPKK